MAWCGGPSLSDCTKHDLHLLLHTLSAADTQKSEEAARFELHGALQALATDDTFVAATRVNGLPFGAGDIASGCVGTKHIALLLTSGVIFRFAVNVEQSTLDRLAAAASGQSQTSTALSRLEHAEKVHAAQLAKVSHGLQLQPLWIIPAAAVS